MTPTALRATGDRVLIQKHAKARQDGAIHLPERFSHPSWEATVISMGQKSWDLGVDLAPGQRVLVKPYAGFEIEHAGQKFTMIETQDVLGILEG